MQAGVVRLETGTTKNGKGREFPSREMGQSLRHVLHAGDELLKASGSAVSPRSVRSFPDTMAR